MLRVQRGVRLRGRGRGLLCAGSVWGERQGVCGRVGLRGKAGRRTHAEDKGVLSATVCLVRAGSWVLLRCTSAFCVYTSCAPFCVWARSRGRRGVWRVSLRGGESVAL